MEILLSCVLEKTCLFPQSFHIDFDFFFNSYYKAVYFLACKFLKDEDKVEDIVMESFVKVWERREKFEIEVKAKAYLYKCVYHGCLMEIRRKTTDDGRRKEMEVKVKVDVEEGYIENMIRAETLRQVYEAMDQLPVECRKVFVKLFVEGKSVADAANELKVAVSTVKNQKARGVKLLRMKLGLSFLVFGLLVVT